MAILSGKIRRGGRGYAGLSHPFGKAPQGRGGMQVDSDLATDTAKRELFDRLASHLIVLADQVEHEMLKRKP